MIPAGRLLVKMMDDKPKTSFYRQMEIESAQKKNGSILFDIGTYTTTMTMTLGNQRKVNHQPNEDNKIRGHHGIMACKPQQMARFLCYKFGSITIKLCDGGSQID